MSSVTTWSGKIPPPCQLQALQAGVPHFLAYLLFIFAPLLLRSLSILIFC